MLFRSCGAMMEISQEFGFDAAVFHPDEYHPAFTSTEDTWAFVREDVAAPGNYRSARFLERRLVRGTPVI